MKHQCSYHVHTLKVEEEFVFDFPFDMMTIRNYVQEILIKLNIKEQLRTFQEADFDYLSQDKKTNEQKLCKNHFMFISLLIIAIFSSIGLTNIKNGHFKPDERNNQTEWGSSIANETHISGYKEWIKQ
ncbi:hypothetical protein SC499_25705 [Peribacillus simplex]|uniref:hypothetical protein n=1 Tax=Peribacillus simplex TaxID=1478 RepID=UPI00298E0897|nr:hypothetical protein [Peribacillus simplex]MDW7617956.1 hypothetical protein [Peribacillus simplex]